MKATSDSRQQHSTAPNSAANEATKEKGTEQDTRQTPNERTNQETPRLFFTKRRGARAAVGGLGVSPKKSKRSNHYSAACETLAPRSHNGKAGVASVATERSLGRGGHPDAEPAARQGKQCEATL
ncbi:MAG: hypothetical protein NHB32_25065 [Fischerella sp. CENA71]|nr:hypothetical protein [Fischerella sp. CENA71]